MGEHWCKDGTLPVCPECGRVWEYVMTFTKGPSVYTSEIVARRYEAMYGKLPENFHPVEVSNG